LTYLHYPPAFMRLDVTARRSRWSENYIPKRFVYVSKERFIRGLCDVTFSQCFEPRTFQLCSLKLVSLLYKLKIV